MYIAIAYPMELPESVTNTETSSAIYCRYMYSNNTLTRSRYRHDRHE